ncbi:MAG TPA: hypothetical protein VIV11_41095 [Kofleriaceae bacterium]
MIERLRARLIATAPAGYTVTDKRTQYFMDEDSAAFCDIAVSGGGREFALVVCRGSDDTKRNEFFARVWLYYAPEVWLVDEEAKRVLRATQDAPALVEVTDQLAPIAIAGVRFNVADM